MPTNPFHPVPEDLPRLERLIWQELSLASQPSDHPWRLVNLATVEDNQPQQRIVVLRDLNEAARQLIVQTDLRSAKIEQIRQQPRVCWLFYHWDYRVQLTAHGQATIHTNDALADRQWEATELSSRGLFLAPFPPGSAASQPSINLPAHLAGHAPTAAEAEEGRQNFAAIVGEVESLDLLVIQKAGNVRARWTWDGSCWSGTWRHP